MVPIRQRRQNGKARCRLSGLRRHLGVSVRKRSRESGRREVAARLRRRHLIALEAAPALPVDARRPPGGTENPRRRLDRLCCNLREAPPRTGTGVRDLPARPPREKFERNPNPFSRAYGQKQRFFRAAAVTAEPEVSRTKPPAVPEKPRVRAMRRTLASEPIRRLPESEAARPAAEETASLSRYGCRRHPIR